MDDTSLKNKKAWEYRAYEFWNMNYGKPQEKAAQIIKNPMACLKYHQKYFEKIKELNIANICGSNGRRAVPLALLGANVTVFDISEENQRYALELADFAGVTINYELCDFYDVDLNRYETAFDIAYLEGGILHYFHDIDRFASLLYRILKPGGKLILSDFHPLRKIIATSISGKDASLIEDNYFDSEIYSSDVAYKNFFPQDEQANFPDSSLRFYTLSEIINAVISAGFYIREFNEHPDWKNSKIPGDFTIFAVK